jgi:BirA family transcriptional regulator, biotin operon repressor / biotin---[acetyl-CoA-carboxylase] ligase
VTAPALTPDAVRPFLRGRFGEPFLWQAECASTQALLDDGDLPEGAVAATDHQTAGRGRYDRAWEDAPGTSLLLSLLLRPPADPDLPQLSLVCALATAETVEAATELTAQVKWPNDVMLDRRKVAGILLEARHGAVVCGVGVNVNQTRDQLPAGTSLEAGSLRSITGLLYDRAVLLGDLLARLEAGYDTWRSEGLQALHAAVGARNFLFGRQVRVDGQTGLGGAILQDGRLELVLPGGDVRRIESGEVAVER